MHTLKIAGASYEGVKVVHFLDESGNTCDYVDASEIAEDIIKGGVSFSASLVTDEGLELLTGTGEAILASKNF